MPNSNSGFDYSVIEMFDEPALFTDEALTVVYQNKAATSVYGALCGSARRCYEHLKGFNKKCHEAVEHIEACSADLLMNNGGKSHYSIHEHSTDSGEKYFLMEKFYNQQRGLFLQIHTDVTDIVEKHLNNSLLNKSDVESMCFDSFGVNIKSVKDLVGFS